MTSPRDARIQRQVNAQIADEVARLRDEIPPAIAEGIRIQANRPPTERGSLSLQFGTVDTVFDDYVSVRLDGSTAPVSCTTLGPLDADDRVAVFNTPNSGALAIGDRGGAGTGVQSVVAGTNVTVDATDPQNPIISASGGSGFPVGPEDDGTSAAEIQHFIPLTGVGQLLYQLTNDSSGAFSEIVQSVESSGNVSTSINAISGSDIAQFVAAVISGQPVVEALVGAGVKFQVSAVSASFFGSSQFSLNLHPNGESASIGVYSGDPNGVVTGLAGSVLLDSTPGPPWYNTDGATAWTQLT